MTRRHLPLCLGLLLAGCEHEPMEYIPPADRALLQAQARLAGGGSGAGPVTVQDMLARARDAKTPDGPTGTASRAPEPLVLRFASGVVMPDAQQRETLGGFATAAQGRRLIVLSRPGVASGATPMLGQRRAMAVARALRQDESEIELRFSSDAPPDVVVVSLGDGAQRQATQ